MKITVFGLGYVGSVVSACLANEGHQITGVDVDKNKVDSINQGRSPIVEPGLAEAGNLRAATTTDRLEDISFVCVGTPSNQNGSFGLSQLTTVIEQIGDSLRQRDSFHIVNIRSTVLPGTLEATIIPLLEAHSRK